MPIDTSRRHTVFTLVADPFAPLLSLEILACQPSSQQMSQQIYVDSVMGDLDLIPFPYDHIEHSSPKLETLVRLRRIVGFLRPPQILADDGLFPAIPVVLPHLLHPSTRDLHVSSDLF